MEKMHNLPESRQSIPGWIFQQVSRRVVGNRLYPSQHRYNLTIGSRPKFVWFRVAKVGTRTIFEALRKAGVVFETENGIFRHYRPARFSDHFKFGFVRDPVDRFLSCWRDRVLKRNHFGFSASEHRRMHSLDAFIEFAGALDLRACDVHLRWQSRLLDVNNIDLLGRMEFFEADMTLVLSTLGLSLEGIPCRNVSRDRDQSHQADSRQRKTIANLYEHDRRVFGYLY
jgi:hypothetical protein